MRAIPKLPELLIVHVNLLLDLGFVIGSCHGMLIQPVAGHLREGLSSCQAGHALLEQFDGQSGYRVAGGMAIFHRS